MNEKIIMLGTGSAMVTDCYNTCFLLKSENDCLLVDAGGGKEQLVCLFSSGNHNWLGGAVAASGSIADDGGDGSVSQNTSCLTANGITYGAVTGYV